MVNRKEGFEMTDDDKFTVSLIGILISLLPIIYIVQALGFGK